ncbi:putative N-formylglutamate amidohydrolase [Pararhizobium capsulatum DSM 1112]|uniref:N-formylglutamate amidohydrolase n=1 Tax=Pararhizobium capsulatum DSM 1112 TaxID=1121113 RepID=A0ABU0BRW1_9HYPH|nr:N-formylglutamate amidohydrolase [Pararhizobium capsulatum]MDQ0320985.1 putative N-formylglutamate amidohydrolase [Pararhizobium capsulatum DSM 1112]
MVALLSAEEGDPVAVENAEGSSPVVVVCEHASRRMPESLGNLGLSEDALESHIAWDPGALAVSHFLAQALDAVLVCQRFSRLAYDCNRPPESPGAMPETSEIYSIPGNVALSREARAARVEALYFPFHRRIETLLQEHLSDGRAPVLVTVHSFTPVYFGKRRAVEIGMLHDADARLADGMLAAAERTKRYDVRRNEPYGPQDGVTHTLKLHGLANGLPNVMIEVRNDLIANETSQRVMADYLAGLLRESLQLQPKN